MNQRVRKSNPGRGPIVTSAGDRPTRPPLRVVVADNDPDALDLVATDLRFEGHEVVAAVLDGEGAIEACGRGGVDVLVVDYRMPPGPNGVEVARRALAADPGLSVIIYSNYQDPRVVHRAKAVGARFLPKGNIRRLRREVEKTAQ